MDQPKRHTIVDMMSETLTKVHEMVDVNTVVGNPITTPDGTTLIPVSKVSIGYGAGGSDWSATGNAKQNFGGGAGTGFSLTPICFLVVSPQGVKVLSMKPGERSTADKIVDAVPDVIEKVEGLIQKFKG